MNPTNSSTPSAQEQLRLASKTWKKPLIGSKPQSEAKASVEAPMALIMVVLHSFTNKINQQKERLDKIVSQHTTLIPASLPCFAAHYRHSPTTLTIHWAGENGTPINGNGDADKKIDVKLKRIFKSMPVKINPLVLKKIGSVCPRWWCHFDVWGQFVPNWPQGRWNLSTSIPCRADRKDHPVKNWRESRRKWLGRLSWQI